MTIKIRKLSAMETLELFGVPPAEVGPSHTHTRAEAIAARDRAMEQVVQNADAEWWTAALQCVTDVALRKTFFTTDDVWDVIDQQPALWQGLERRAMGPLMRRACREMLCQPTLEYQNGRRPVAHCRPIRVYVSLIEPAPVATDA